MTTSPSATSARHILRVTAERTLEFDFTVWQWGDAIAIDGLLEAGTILRQHEYIDRVATYYRNWSQRVLSWQDHLCPGRGLLQIYAITKEQNLLDAAVRLAATLRAAPRALRTGAPLYRPDLGLVRANVWVDSIYHEPSFFCDLARATGERKYYDDALDVWFTHVDALTSSRGPFLHHAVETGMHAYKGYGWGRGQGWALYGMIDALERLPSSHPRYNEASTSACTLAEHLLRKQDQSGFWRTLLEDREAYLESSTASFIGGAFYRGVRLNILTSVFSTAADRAWAAAISRIDMTTGEMTGVSAWTLAGTTFDDQPSMYKTLPTEVNWWGQGGAMRFAAERIHNGSE